MNSLAIQTINVQIPVELTAAIEHLAIELGCSRNCIINEVLTRFLAERERRHQSIQAGLADVDAGRVVSHSDMVDFDNRLKET